MVAMRRGSGVEDGAGAGASSMPVDVARMRFEHGGDGCLASLWAGAFLAAREVGLHSVTQPKRARRFWSGGSGGGRVPGLQDGRHRHPACRCRRGARTAAPTCSPARASRVRPRLVRSGFDAQPVGRPSPGGVRTGSPARSRFAYFLLGPNRMRAGGAGRRRAMTGNQEGPNDTDSSERSTAQATRRRTTVFRVPFRLESETVPVPMSMPSHPPLRCHV